MRVVFVGGLSYEQLSELNYLRGENYDGNYN